MDETLKRQAYLEGLKLKNQGYDSDVTLARLNKLGVPDDIAKEVVRNLFIQKIIDADKAARPFYNLALLKIGLGILLAVISAVVFSGMSFIPIGFIISGVVWYLGTRKNIV